jgi:hypothetical protein
MYNAWDITYGVTLDLVVKQFFWFEVHYGIASTNPGYGHFCGVVGYIGSAGG